MGSPCLFTRQQVFLTRKKMGYFYWLRVKSSNHLHTEGLEKSELPWEQSFFYTPVCVSCRTSILPSFNGLRCKLVKIALFINLIQNWVECMTSSVISSKWKYLQTVNGVCILMEFYCKNLFWYHLKRQNFILKVKVVLFT